MTNQTQVNKKLSPISIPDIIALVGSLLVIVSFLVLPWLTRPLVRAEVFGATAGLPQPAGALISFMQRPNFYTHNIFLEEPLSSLFIEGETTFTANELLNDPYYTETISVAIGLPLIGACLGVIFALWGMFVPSWRKATRWGQFVSGLIIVIYYLLFFLKYPFDSITPFIHIGFWLSVVGTVMMIGQVVLPRQVPPRIQPVFKGHLNDETGIVNLQDAKLIKGQSLYTKAFARLSRDYLTLLMLGVVFLIVLFSLGAPLIEQGLNVSYRTTSDNIFAGIDSGKHFLGTDDLGRDQLARLAYAGRISMAIALFAALLSLFIGVAMGIFTGFYGGIIDDLVMWFITTLNSIPSLFLLLIVSAVLKPGVETMVLILGLLGWTGTTRLVRGETLSLREREFVVSARSIGASDVRIMFSHIFPNLISLVVVTLALDIGSLLLTEASLSYLGLGVQPPTPTWGNMLTNSQTFFSRGPHLVIFPGLLIAITVLALYVIGDGIRDALDPRTND
jgi:peptide/nickel transport system permease protein